MLAGKTTEAHAKRSKIRAAERAETEALARQGSAVTGAHNIDVDTLSDADPKKLTEETLRRLRGDEL